MEKSEESSRRRFLRRISGLGVAAGAGTVLLSRDRSLMPLAQAGSGSGQNVQLDEDNYGSPGYGTTIISNIWGAAFRGKNTNPDGGSGVDGWATSLSGTTTGVYGQSDSTQGKGVAGVATGSSGTTYGVYGASHSPDGIGVYGVTSGGWTGVYGKSGSTTARGVWGHVSNVSGFTYGVLGESESIDGTGVRGYADNQSGNTFGVYGRSDSISGRGVYGYAYNQSGTTSGVYGQSDSNLGRGVYGSATNQSGNTFGVYGESSSISGRGVCGYATNQNGFASGVYGQSDSNLGRGVYGSATNQSGNTCGVYGESSSISGRGVQGWAYNQSGDTCGVYGWSYSVSGIGVLGVAGRWGGVPVVAMGASGQTSSLQEWRNKDGTPLSVVDKDGQLGVGTGTSGPVWPLHVSVPSSFPAGRQGIRLEGEGRNVGQFIWCYGDGNIPFFSGRRARGSMASPSAVQADDILMRYGGAGYDGSAFPGANKAILEFKAAENWTSSAQGTYVTISTTPTGQTATAERLRVTSEGRLGIGLSNPSYQLQLSTDSAAKPSTNTWTVASDSRLKDPDSVKPFTEGSDLIRRLPQPVWFRYAKDSGLPADTANVGWIAQDILPVAPFMVRRTRQKLKATDEAESEALALNTNELPYAILNCLKETLSELEGLKARLATLEQTIKEPLAAS